MVEEVEKQCGVAPLQVLADSGFFSLSNVQALERRAIQGYVPDANMARELNSGQPCPAHNRPRHGAQRRMRQRLRSPDGRARYGRRKALVEPIFGSAIGAAKPFFSNL